MQQHAPDAVKIHAIDQGPCRLAQLHMPVAVQSDY